MKHRHTFPTNWLSPGLCLLLLLQPASAPAQAPAPAPAQAPPPRISVIVTEGEGSVNRLRQRASHEPAVKVEDDDHRPVEGAAVAFTLPADGTTGEFSNHAKTLTVVTGKDGIATGHGLRTNQVPGRLQIHVNASYRGRSARAIITQFNMSGPDGQTGGGGHGGKIALVLVLVGAAAAGGAAAALRGKSTTTGTITAVPVSVPITVTPGTGTITGPR